MAMLLTTILVIGYALYKASKEEIIPKEWLKDKDEENNDKTKKQKQ